jgi:hypothetical protein
MFRLTLSFALCLAAFGCWHRPNRVLYVFPNTFRGLVIIEGEVKDGLKIQATNGVKVLHVPTSGKLKIQGKLPTRDWHSPSAQFEDGESIPLASGNPNIGKDVIALRTVGSSGPNVAWLVVGTYDDAAKAQEKMRGFQWPSSK